MLFPLKLLILVDPQHLEARAHHEIMSSKFLFLCLSIVSLILIMEGGSELITDQIVSLKAES